MLRYFRTKSRLDLFEKYIKNAVPEDITLLETNFFFLLSAQRMAIVREHFTGGTKIDNAFKDLSNSYDLELKIFEKIKCSPKDKFVEKELLHSKALSIDQRRLFNKPLSDFELSSSFLVIHWLTSYLLFFHYESISHKKIRRKFIKIISILRENKKRKASYKKLALELCPAFQEYIRDSEYTDEQK